MGGLPTRAQQTANSETLQVQAAASTVDTITGNDAKSLYYAAPAASVSAGKAAGAGGGGSGFNAARTAAGGRSKKAPTQEEQTLTNSKVETPHALNLGVKYVLLRKTAAGSFQAVDAERLQTGDTLELQLTPNDSGTLHVRARGTGGEWRDAFLRSVPAGQMYTVPLNPGDSELQVTLTRLTVTVAGAALRDDRSAVQRKSESDATYVVASPSATQLQFPITLNYK